MNKYIINNYERISKTTAKKLFLNGEKIEMFPCKAVPGSVWFPYGYTISREAQKVYAIDETGIKNRFDSLVNSFEFYNCNSQSGYYAAFYRKIEKA